MAPTLEARVNKHKVNGIRHELLDIVPLKDYLGDDGCRIPLTTEARLGARLWKRKNGSVRFYGVYGLLGLLNDADLEPYKIIPIDAQELHFPNPNKLSEYQYTRHQHSNGFF